MKVASVLIITFLIDKSNTQPPFFWNPRLSIAIQTDTTKDDAKRVYPPTAENVRKGYVVMIDGYKFSATLVQLCLDDLFGDRYAVDRPLTVRFYNTAYRWGLRYLTMIPDWLKGVDTYPHDVWRTRFYYTNRFVPTWMTHILPTLGDHKEWEKERTEFQKYRKLAENEFRPFYTFSTKTE